ncbi:mitochondrial import protein Pam17 [Chytridium lagenaria]|nr:mitochondrial import protein Pam17 [Chytridium lagenaria]
MISWKEYFGLRRSKKVAERAGGVVAGLLGLTVSGYYFFAVAEFDPTEPVWIFPDPSMAYALGIFLTGGVCAGAGIIAGGQIWRALQRSQVLKAIDLDPVQETIRGQLSIDNPAPDYYGEAVTSVSEYRAWLKKQRAYRLKMGDFRAVKAKK